MHARKLCLPLLAALLLSSCATRDKVHRIVISVPEQRMIVYQKDQPIAEFPISTSKYCLSDTPGSRGTPLGEMEIARKIGGGEPSGMKFTSRHATGEIVAPDAPGRDPIVSRILWLRGLEAQNRNAFGRCIYIHGTTEEAKIGQPASFGCIRMRSHDVIQLFDIVGVGAQVRIVNQPFMPAVPVAPASAVGG